MRTVVSVAGYDKSDSDGFRKVISKKKKKLLPLHKKWFIEGRKENDLDEDGRMKKYPHPIPGGISLGHNKEDLEKFFTLMEDFGSYAFNKSHAASYAVVAYCTAWFIYYYPTEFFAALLNSVQKDKAKCASYIKYCKEKLSIDIEPVDINKSTERFIPLKNKTIFYSMKLKNTSSDVIENIIKERDEHGLYKDFDDFMLRNIENIDKKTFKALVCSRAFNTIKCQFTNSELLCADEDIFDKIQKAKQAKKRAEKSEKPFDFKDKIEGIYSVIPPNLKELTDDIFLRLEQEYLGFYLTGNPLNKYTYLIDNYSNFSTLKLGYEIDENTGSIIYNPELNNNSRVKMVGILEEIDEITTKKKQLMAICQISDLNGYGKVLIWPDTYTQLKGKIKEGEIYKIEGSIKADGEEAPIIIANNFYDVEENALDRIFIKINDYNEATEILNYIKSNPLVVGNNPIYVIYKGIEILFSRKYWVNLNTFKTEKSFKILKY